MYSDLFKCIQMYSNVSVQMELLTFGSVPISRPSWAAYGGRRGAGWQGYCPRNGVSLSLKPTKQTLCIKTCPNTIFPFSNTQKDWLSARPASQQIAYYRIYSEIKIKTFHFRKHLFQALPKYGWRSLCLRESCHPWTLSVACPLFCQQFQGSCTLEEGVYISYWVSAKHSFHGTTLCWVFCIGEPSMI